MSLASQISALATRIGQEVKTKAPLIPRVTTIGSSATPTVNVDVTDLFTVTSQAVPITSVTITGTPREGQRLLVRVRDNGKSCTIGWGTSFVSGPATLLTKTTAGKTHLSQFVYDSTAAKWVATIVDPTGY